MTVHDVLTFTPVYRLVADTVTALFALDWPTPLSFLLQRDNPGNSGVDNHWHQYTRGREIAKTHNSMLITEAAASGTKVKDFASATAIAAGEPEAIMFNDALSYYLEDGGSIAWVTRPSTFGAVAALTGNARLYAQTPSGSFQKQLLGYPVEYSQAVTAPAASAKSLYFANWNYVGYREGPELRFIMDPYSVDGLVILKYSFRAVVGVLQAAAVGYGLHPTG